MKENKCKPATKAELKWIEDFQKLAKKCPKSLWVFSGSGTLFVMKYPPSGEVMGENQGVSPDNIISTIKGIANDGGDW